MAGADTAIRTIIMTDGPAHLSEALLIQTWLSPA